MRRLFAAIFISLLVAISPARAQLTQSGLNAEIQTNLPTGGSGITALELRNTLTDMVTASFQMFSYINVWSQLQGFQGGIISNTWGSYNGAPYINGLNSVSGSPNVTLNNIFGGASQGGGLLWNSFNAASTSITAHYTNCGFNVITAGSEQGTCDDAYRAPSGVNQVITTAINGSGGGCRLCVGNTDNFWSLGTSSVMYSNVFGRQVTTGGYTIGTLPTCNAGNIGARAYVTNGQTTPTFMGAVSTTGAVVAPVFCTGAGGWVYG
jgi:hypothetical protein